MRSALLTFRMHKFEVAIAIGLVTLTAVSALVAYTHVTAANPPDACWIQNWDFEGTLPKTPGCDDLVNAFWPVAGEAGFVASPIAVSLPFIVGLLLGVPIVGRELELRTAALAWSLSGDRTRWLLRRVIPMLALTLFGLAIAGSLVAVMAVASHHWNFKGPGRIPDLTELGSEGPSLVGRGIMAFGIALLAGAAIGRTLPAVALAALICFGWMFVGAPQLQGVVGDRVAVWQATSGEDPTLGFFGSGYRASDGTILTFDDAESAYRQGCPDCQDDDSTWLEAHYTPVARVASISSYPVFEWTEIVVTSGIGLVCILLTFPVVSRRRPG